MKTKGILLASVAGTLVAPAAANAADMPVKAAPRPVAAPVVVAPSWAGLYVGVHAGAAWHRSKADQPGAYYAPLHLGDTKTGFAGGGLIGYNLQFGNIIAGVEADISGLGAKTNDSETVFAGPGGNTGFPLLKRTAESDIDWMATLRARLGFTTGNLLVFVTGGVAWADIENTVTVKNLAFFPGQTVWSEKKTKTAGVVGGGAEYMFSPNWIGRVEGLWADFGKSSISSGRGSSLSDNNKATTFKNRVVVVRGALSYKF